ncbi:uncharacterized protein LOC110106519 [Dendrobium catenatum]|nr:uncharacterized protein LOC110106519 [Dendrobium catenatum]
MSLLSFGFVGVVTSTGVEIPCLNDAEKVDPTSCSRNARRNVATVFRQLVIDDFSADFIKGDRFTAHILHLLESTRKEQQYELFKACEVVSFPRNDLLGRGKDKEFVMQWLWDPSNEHLGTEAFAQIIQLEKWLKDQLEVHLTLEKALGYRKEVIDSSNVTFMPKPAKELIREIAVLELEVMHLEQHLLSLYRKDFEQQLPTSSSRAAKAKQPISFQRKLFHELPGPEISSLSGHPLVHSTRILPSQITACKLTDESYCQNISDRNVHRCHSALNQRAVYSSRISPSEAALARALQDCHS